MWIVIRQDDNGVKYQVGLPYLTPELAQEVLNNLENFQHKYV